MKKTNHSLSDLEQEVGSEAAGKIYDILSLEMGESENLINVYEDVLRTIVVDILKLK